VSKKALVKVLLKSAPVSEVKEVPDEQEEFFLEDDDRGGSEMFVETRTKSVPQLIEGIT